jgi:hypothetical protein
MERFDLNDSNGYSCNTQIQLFSTIVLQRFVLSRIPEQPLPAAKCANRAIKFCMALIAMFLQEMGAPVQL